MPEYLRCAIAVGFILAGTSEGLAVSERLKNACRDDYRAFCSAFDVGSPEVRACMRSVRAKLSKKCVHELARSDEVTQEDIQRYKREMKDD